MLEDSVEGFVARFRASAADVLLSGHVEGNPLLECVAAGTAFHVFERTGPYLARSGPARVILHVECDAVERLVAAEEDGAADAEAVAGARRLEVVGVSAITADGEVLLRDDPFLVVDVGVPIVVGLTGAMPAVEVGDLVRFASRAPIHGFVLPRVASRAVTSLDDQV